MPDEPKGLAVERLLLPKYTNNDILKYLIKLRWMYTKFFMAKIFFFIFEVFILFNTLKHGESNGYYSFLKL